jgi:hypothetical protein
MCQQGSLLMSQESPIHHTKLAIKSKHAFAHMLPCTKSHAAESIQLLLKHKIKKRKRQNQQEFHLIALAMQQPQRICITK